MWDKTQLRIVPIHIKLADIGDRPIHWWSDDLSIRGEGRERKGRCWSRCSDTSFLTHQYCLCFLWPLPGNQQSTRNMEKFVCNLGNYIKAFGLWKNVLWCLEVHGIFLLFPRWMHVRRGPAQTWVEGKWDQFFGHSGSQIRSSQICICLKSVYIKIYSETGKFSVSSQQLWSPL